MSSIFLIAHKDAHGPWGHGEPAPKYLAIRHDGERDGYGWSLGLPHPAYTTRDKAEEERKKFDTFGSYVVIEVELQEAK